MRLDIRHLRPTIPSMIGSVLLIAAIAVVLTATMGAEDENLAKDRNDIKTVVLRAFDLTHGGTTKLPQPYSTDASSPVPAAVKGMMHKNALSSLQDVYSANSPILADRVELMQREIDKQGDNGYRDLGGGMRFIRNLTIQVDGDSAVAEADIRAWSTFIAEGKKFTPENTAHYRFTLAREAAAWKITDEEFTFLPGQEA